MGPLSLSIQKKGVPSGHLGYILTYVPTCILVSLYRHLVSWAITILQYKLSAHILHSLRMCTRMTICEKYFAKTHVQKCIFATCDFCEKENSRPRPYWPWMKALQICLKITFCGQCTDLRTSKNLNELLTKKIHEFSIPNF